MEGNLGDLAPRDNLTVCAIRDAGGRPNADVNDRPNVTMICETYGQGERTVRKAIKKAEVMWLIETGPNPTKPNEHVYSLDGENGSYFL